MYCGNCGAKNEDGAIFCEQCGGPLVSSVPGNGYNNGMPNQGQMNGYNNGMPNQGQMNGYNNGMPNQGQMNGYNNGMFNQGQMNGYNNGIPKKKKPIPKKVFIIGGSVVAAVVAIIVIFCIVLNRPVTVNLNDYIELSTTGYDGYGSGEVVIDWDKIEEEYGDKLSVKKQNNAIYETLESYVEPVDVLKQLVRVNLEQTTDLSNGMKVNYTWNVNERLKDYITGNIEYEDNSIEITGLEQVGTFDAFANLEVSFSGIAPAGEVEWEYNGTDLSDYDFKCDKESGLSNGDTIIISIDSDDMEYYVDTLGKVPQELQKEYTVGNLSTYVSKLDQISEADLEAMKQQAEDEYNASAVEELEEEQTLESLTYIGNYLLTAKNPDTIWGDNNRFYLVYKAKIHSKHEDEDKDDDEDESFDKVTDSYWCISFKDLMINGDKLEVDITEGEVPYASFSVESTPEDSWSSIYFNFPGYETLDGLYKEVVTANADEYNHEDNVSE